MKKSPRARGWHGSPWPWLALRGGPRSPPRAPRSTLGPPRSGPVWIHAMMLELGSVCWTGGRQTVSVMGWRVAGLGLAGHVVSRHGGGGPNTRVNVASWAGLCLADSCARLSAPEVRGPFLTLASLARPPPPLWSSARPPGDAQSVLRRALGSRLPPAVRPQVSPRTLRARLRKALTALLPDPALCTR